MGVNNVTGTEVILVIGLLVGAVSVGLGAVWFGLRILAPRIGRALDRAERDEDLGDRRD